MSSLDILLLIVFAIAVIRGMRRGLIGQLGSLAAIILAIIVCRATAATAAPAMEFIVPDSLKDSPMGGYISSIAAGALIYVIVYYGVTILSRTFKTLTHALMLGPVDRVLGAIFSLFKWGLGLSVGLNLWLALFPQSRFVKDSTLGGGVAVENVMELAPWLWGVATHTGEQTTVADETL